MKFLPSFPRLFLRLCGVVGLAAAWPLAAAEPVNLIGNGNFETDSKKQNWPDGWGHAKGQTSTWEQEGDNHFLRLARGSPATW